MTSPSRGADWTLQADEVRSARGIITASGDVLVSHGAHSWTAELAQWVEQASSVRLTNGRWHLDPVHTVDFFTLTLDVETGAVSVTDVQFRDGKGLKVSAETLNMSANGEQVNITDVSATTCDCEGTSPWSVRATSATWQPGDWIALQGAQVEVFERPVTPPFPTTIPLSRRSGLLAPTLSWGYDGPLIATPLYLTGGRSFDLTVTPEVRPLHGTRVHLDPRWALKTSTGDYRATVGWDGWEKQFRGAFSGLSTWKQGIWAWQSETDWLSDLSVRQDYNDRWLDRSRTWTESRWLLSGYGVELAGRTVQHADETLQSPLDLAFRQAARSLPGGFLLSGTVGTMQGVITDDLMNPGPWSGTAFGTTTLTRPTRAGPTQFTPRITTGLDSAFDASSSRGSGRPVASGFGIVGTHAALPLWRDGAHHFERLEPFVDAEVGLDSGRTGDALDANAITDKLVWKVEPGVSWRRSESGALFEVYAQAPITQDGWAGHARVRFTTGPWQLRGQLQTRPTELTGADVPEVELATLSTGFDAEALSASLRWIWADIEPTSRLPSLKAHLGSGRLRWRLPAAANVIELTGGADVDLVATALQSTQAGLIYTHPTGCLRLGAEARFAVDRPLPDVSLVVDIRPAR